MDTEAAGAADEEEDIPAATMAAIQTHSEGLAKERKALAKARKKGAAIEGLTSAEAIASFTEGASHTGVHSASSPGITCLALGAGKILTGGNDKTAHLFDLDAEKDLTTFKGHKKKVTSVALHPTADVAVTGSADSTIRIWSTSNGKSKHIVKTHSADVTAVSLHPTGDYLLSASADRHWGFTSLETGKTMSLMTDASVTSGLTCASWHPDGMLLATGTADSQCHIWSIKDQTKAHTFSGHTGIINALSFSENGFHLATASEDATVKLWDLRKLVNFQTIEFEASNAIKSIGFDLSGSYLACGGSDIRIYDAKTCEQIKTLAGHTAAVTGVAWSPNASGVVSTSLDRSIRIFK